MDKIIDKILENINEKISESDNELKLFKIMLLVFYIYYGENHKEINSDKKLYKISKKEKRIIEDEIIKHDFLEGGIELYKLGLKFDKLIEASSRSKTGSFYTPEDLSIGIVKLTVSDYFKRKDARLYSFFRENNNDAIYETEDDLEVLVYAYKELIKLNVVDLSCGTGMFLLSFINLIIEIRLNIDKLSEKISVECEKLDSFSIDRVYGFDIQKKPLNILKLSMLDLLMRHEFLVSENLSINCYDTLKASNSRILSNDRIKDGFDIVFGNPPYIGEKGNKELFNDIKKSKFGIKYYEGKMDYFYYFIYKGMSLLKDDGVLGYITTNYFVSADGALKLRKYLKLNCSFLSIVNFNDLILFSSAPGQHNMVFTLNRQTKEPKETSVTVISREEVKNDYSLLRNVDRFSYSINEEFLYDENSKIILMKESSYHEIINLIISKSNLKIDDFISVKQGIVSGADKVSKLMLEKKLSKETIDRYNMKKDDPIYVVESLESIDIEEEFIRPFYKNSCIDTYFAKDYTDKSIVYISKEVDAFKTRYPKTYKHLEKYREVLSNRREVLNGAKARYLLQWGRNEEVFSKERIVVPQRSSRNKFALAKENFYASADIYYLCIHNTMGLDESDINYYLLGILNSKLYYFWLYNMGKRKGNLLELYSKPISQIPIYLDASSELYISVVELVRKIFLLKENLNESSEKNDKINLIKEDIDLLIYKEYGLDDKKIESIEKLFFKNIVLKFKDNLM